MSSCVRSLVRSLVCALVCQQKEGCHYPCAPDYGTVLLARRADCPATAAEGSSSTGASPMGTCMLQLVSTRHAAIPGSSMNLGAASQGIEQGPRRTSGTQPADTQ